MAEEDDPYAFILVEAGITEARQEEIIRRLCPPRSPPPPQTQTLTQTKASVPINKRKRSWSMAMIDEADPDPGLDPVVAEDVRNGSGSENNVAPECGSSSSGPPPPTIPAATAPQSPPPPTATATETLEEAEALLVGSSNWVLDIVTRRTPLFGTEEDYEGMNILRTAELKGMDFGRPDWH